ncbi:hypothetical protein C8Q76DRAFT_624321 [Earliella scabrosa]|nr:hypothetical protein C8Q76DRAFT_624321 [Earliella scabrosa]
MNARDTPFLTPRMPDSRPVPVPASPEFTLTHNLTKLNDALEEWGFNPEPRFLFADVVRLECASACLDATRRTQWVAAREDWIEAGDRILDTIEDIICGGTLEGMSPRHFCNMYRILCSVAIKVQYMIVTVEVALDTLLVHPHAQ